MNLEIYEKVRQVPAEAKKEITNGKLKGKTDINPMWRIKVLTEQFGPCGFGWYYKILEKRIEKGDANTIAAFVDIELYVKKEDNWSQPIPGTGGSAFVQYFKSAGYSETNDECFKMALTDALSVSCKALGIGADVYWQADATKYTKSEKVDAEDGKKPVTKKAEPQPCTAEQVIEINHLYSTDDVKKILTYYKVDELSQLSSIDAVVVIARKKKQKAGAADGKK